MTTCQNVLFDLDGTLLDTGASIIACHLYTLQIMGVAQPPLESMKQYIGPPLIENFINLVGAARAQEAVEIYRHHYNDEGGMYDAAPYQDIAEVLAALKKAGLKLLVATSKAQTLAQTLVAHFGLADTLDGVYGATLDSSRSSKADIVALAMRTHKLAAAETIMIGDRFHDVEGAKTNNIPCIGVLWGYGSEEELRQAGAIQIAKEPRDLLPLILKCSEL